MYHLPRAVHFDGETMRVFQAAGIAEDLSGRVRENPGMRFVDPEGDLLLDWPRPQGVGPQGWYSSYRLHQPDLEALLRDRLASRDGVAVLSRTEVTAIEDTGNEVILTCRTAEGDERRKLRARYIVGLRWRPVYRPRRDRLGHG